MRLALLSLLFLAAAPRQDLTLDGVLDLLEKRTEGLRDVTLRLAVQTDQPFGMPRGETSATWVRDAGLRVRARCEIDPAAAGWSAAVPSAADYVYTPGRFRLIHEWDGRSVPSGTSFQTLEVGVDDPAFASHDVYLLPAGGYSFRMFFDEPFVFTLLAPRLFLGLEPNLVLEGRRTEGGRTFHVLTSTRAPRPPELPRTAYLLETRRRQYFVDAATGELAKIQWEMSFRFDLAGAGGKEQRMKFVAEPLGARKLTDRLSLPETVRWTSTVEGGGGSRGGEFQRRITAGPVNAGLGATEILSAAEKEDLYADAVFRREEEYEARLRKDPKDAVAHYTLGLLRGIADPFARAVPGVAGAKVEPAAVLPLFEKASGLRPQAEAPRLNALSVRRAMGDPAREKEQLEAMAADPAAGNRVVLRVAARLSDLGDGAAASTLLDRFRPATAEERDRAALERLFLTASKGKEEAILAAFAEEAGRRTTSAGKTALVRAMRTRAESLPEGFRAAWTADKLSALLDRGRRGRPEEAAWRIAKAELLRSQGKPASAAAELLEAGGGDVDLVDRALEALDPVRMGFDPAETKTEAEPAELSRLAAALAAAARGDPRLEYQEARALAQSGKPEEARSRLDAAFEASRGKGRGKPYHGAALRTLLQLGMEKGPDGWRDKCVDEFLSLARDSFAIPYDLIYDDARSPIGGRLGDLASKKDWKGFYKVATAAMRITGGNTVLWRQKESLEGAGIAAIKAEVWKESAAEKYVEFADFLEGVRESGEVVEALEKARDRAPGDLELQERLVRKYAEAGLSEKAHAAMVDLVPRLPAERRPSLQIEVARTFTANQDAARVRQVLDRMDPASLDGGSALACAELYAQIKETDRALVACRRAVQAGLKPHFLMGRLLEEKKDYVEAIRCYNRDRAEGSAESGQDVGRRAIRTMKVPTPGAVPDDKEPTNGEEARERLLRKLGPEWLLKAHLAREFPPLGAEDAGKVKAAIDRLSSDAVEDRDAAAEELKAFGPRATPLLTPLLKSADEEVKTRVKQLLLGWAEPK